MAMGGGGSGPTLGRVARDGLPRKRNLSWHWDELVLAFPLRFQPQWEGIGMFRKRKGASEQGAGVRGVVRKVGGFEV